MSRYASYLAVAVLMTGCTLGGEPPTLPDVPPAPVVMTPLVPETTAPHLDDLYEPAWSPPAPAAPPWTPPVTGPVVAEPRSKARGGKGLAAEGPQSPTQMIDEANRTARMAPTPRGYFGGGGTHRYQWTPGRIYDVYLSPASGTKILFPPGEILAHELVLNPDAFDVSSATIGNEVSKQTVLFIRPCAEGEGACKPSTSVDVALVTESGRSYDLHLIVGKVGMVGVTWAIAPIPHLQSDEAPAPPKGGGR